MNALAWVETALKVWPEPPSLPESLEDASIQELADARARLASIAQTATELRRLIDRNLAFQLDGQALRYGDSLIRPSTRGRAVVVDPEGWWQAVVRGLEGSENPSGLLADLYPAGSVRLSAIPKLALVLEVDPSALRSTFIDYEPPTSTLDVMPMSKAPKWAMSLQDGETGGF